MARSWGTLVLLCAGVWLFGVREAQASTFDVSPIALTLSSKALSGTLVVTNRGTQSGRFHVTAFAWEQDAKGDMVLTPTKDLMFFPAMLTLNPQESRNLRVGVVTKPGAVEKTFRVFVQELPALASADQEQSGRVNVLIKMGIPIFIQPNVTPKAVPSLSAMSFQGATFSFNVNNTGNTHFMPLKMLVKAKDGSKVFHTAEVGGWYVLAGNKDRYSVTLPTEVCLALKSIVVEIELRGGATTTATVENAHCTP